MFDLLFIGSIIGSCVQAFKESNENLISAENWANKELHHQDIMNGVPMEQIIKNAENGKYKLTKKHPEPHRDKNTGKIIVENSKLYNEDLKKYGAYQTYKWVEQGKYNLNPEQLKKEEERMRKHFDYLYSL